MLLINQNELISIADQLRLLNNVNKNFKYPNGFISAIKTIPTENFQSEYGVIVGIDNLNTLNYFNTLSYSSEITFISCPNITDIRNYDFSFLSKLLELNLRDVKLIPMHAFENLSLVKVTFSACETISISAFKNCHNLASINFPNVKIIYSDAFKYCSNLLSINFPECYFIDSGAFGYCYKLKSVYLYNKNRMVHIASDVFLNTPITNSNYLSGEYGSIYLPSILMSQYLAFEPWQILSDRLVFI